MSSTRRRIVPVLRLDLIFISNQAARSKRFSPPADGKQATKTVAARAASMPGGKLKLGCSLDEQRINFGQPDSKAALKRMAGHEFLFRRLELRLDFAEKP